MIEVWRINKRQISKIWAAAKEQGIDREDVYALFCRCRVKIV